MFVYRKSRTIFFLQTLLFTAFLMTVLQILTYALVSTWSLVSSGWEHVKRKMHPCWQQIFVLIIVIVMTIIMIIIKTQNGLKIHKGKAHKEESPPEKVRNPPSQPALVCSPIREATRVEPCHNCGLDMSPSHQCPSDSTMHDEVAVEEPSKCPSCVSRYHPRYNPISLPLFDAIGLKLHYEQHHPPIDF